MRVGAHAARCSRVKQVLLDSIQLGILPARLGRWELHVKKIKDDEDKSSNFENVVFWDYCYHSLDKKMLDVEMLISYRKYTGS